MTQYSSDFHIEIEDITTKEEAWIADRGDNEEWWEEKNFCGDGGYHGTEIIVNEDKTLTVCDCGSPKPASEFIRLFLYENNRTDEIMMAVSYHATDSEPGAFDGFAMLITAKSITTANPEAILTDPDYKPHVQTFETTIDVMKDSCEELQTNPS